MRLTLGVDPTPQLEPPCFDMRHIRVVDEPGFNDPGFNQVRVRPRSLDFSHA